MITAVTKKAAELEEPDAGERAAEAGALDEEDEEDVVGGCQGGGWEGQVDEGNGPGRHIACHLSPCCPTPP